MSSTLRMSRAVVAFIGIGAVLMAVGGLTSGSSLADPVFPGGLVLGALAIGAAAWIEEPGTLRAVVSWLGLAAVLVAIGVFGWFVVKTPTPDVIALFAVPALIVLAALGRLAMARIRAGAAG
jgi:hypothetical protein